MKPSSLVEIYVLYKIVKILTSDWKSLDAYKQGAIDASGYVIKKEKNHPVSYSVGPLERFAFNLKKLVEKVPGGKTTLAKYLVTYQLFLKEQHELEVNNLFEETLDGK